MTRKRRRKSVPAGETEEETDDVPYNVAVNGKDEVEEVAANNIEEELMRQFGLPTKFGLNKREDLHDLCAESESQYSPHATPCAEYTLDSSTNEPRDSKRRRKRPMLSEHYVNSEIFTVKELLGFHPNGLNYFQPTNDTLHIKFDEEGTPIPPETPIAVEITTPVTSNTEDPKSLAKYYRQRYDFFHRFDEGIQIDTEGWYSVTPEAIGHHIAQHSTPGSVVWDAFAGVGGNSIQYALAGMNVVATELDPDRIRMCRENARIYGVDQYIDFLQADALSMKNIWRGGFDTVFLSPPWGGPEYLKSEVYDALTMLPIDCKAMIETATRMKGKLVFYMPKNTELTRLATLLPPNATLTIEKHYLDDRLKVLVIHVL